MTPEKAIEIAIHCLGVQAEQEVCEECPAYLEGGITCREAARTAISALKEIQLYKDGKLCLVPKDVYSKQCCELDAYKEIGTVEECREAVEKQKPKKPHRNYKKFSGLWCKCGWYLGQKQCLDIKYCPNCGQAIDENLEG